MTIRIKYIKQENKGIWRLKETYNKALDNSNGYLIAILEGDDFWPDYKLEKQIDSFNDPEVVFSWGRADIADEKNDITGYRPKAIKWLKKESNKKLYKNLFFGNFIPACTVICRKSALIKIGGFKQCKQFPYVDHTTWLEIGLRGKFIYLDQILGYWRHHETQISSTMSLEMVESLEYGIDFLKKMSKSQKIQINIGFMDLITFNLVHFLYNIIYGLENNNHSDNKKNDNFNLKSNISPYIKLSMFLREFYVIVKINVNWLIFLIKVILIRVYSIFDTFLINFYQFINLFIYIKFIINRFKCFYSKFFP